MNLYGGTISYRTPSGRMSVFNTTATAMTATEAREKALDHLHRHPGKRRVAGKIDACFTLLQENTK